MFKDIVLPQLINVITDEDKKDFVEIMYSFINYREKLIYLALRMRKSKNANDIYKVQSDIQLEIEDSKNLVNKLYELCKKYDLTNKFPKSFDASNPENTDLIINELFTRNSKFNSNDILGGYIVSAENRDYVLDDFLSQDTNTQIIKIEPTFDLRSINEDQILINNMINYFTQTVGV